MGWHWGAQWGQTVPKASRVSHPTLLLGACWGARARQFWGHFGWKREQGPPCPGKAAGASGTAVEQRGGG